VGHERFQEPADLGPDDRQRCRAVLLALPEIEHQAATCLQVDNDGADVAGLIPVELVELFQRGEAASLMGSNELSRTMANIVGPPDLRCVLPLYRLDEARIAQIQPDLSPAVAARTALSISPSGRFSGSPLEETIGFCCASGG
jgi:hypothetical protein